MRVMHKLVVLGATVVAFGGVGMGTALADPSPLPPWPGLTDIVGVGSDTTTPVFSGVTPTPQGQLAFDYDHQSPAPANLLYSWDAVNPATGAAGENIITKTSDPGDNPPTDTTCQFPRPNGSSAGIASLLDPTQGAKMDNGAFCADFARASRGPAATDPDTVAFAAMAGDAIAWSSPAGTATTPSPAPTTLALQDLVNIYTCQVTNWDQVGGSNAPIVPVLPQNGSGTRATFLLALGAADGLAPGTPLPVDVNGQTCVVNGTDANNNPVEENTGVSPGNQNVFGTAANPNVDVMFPYSISAYIAQGDAANGVGGHATSIWAHGPMVLHDSTDDAGIEQTPTTTNDGGQLEINPNFPVELQRTIYNVVRNGGTASAPAFPTTPSYEASALPAIFGPNGWVCTNAAAQADLVSYGFTLLPGLCGSLTDDFLVWGN